MEVPGKELDLGLSGDEQLPLLEGLPDQLYSGRYTRYGKQILFHGQHYGDAVCELRAQNIVDALNERDVRDYMSRP